MTTNTISPRVQKAIDIYLDAINNGTLAKGSSAACAVGNLTAAALGATITRREGLKSPIRALLPIFSENNSFFSKEHKRVEFDSSIEESAYWTFLFFTDNNNVQRINYDPKTECICGQCAITFSEKYIEARKQAIEIIGKTDFTMEELMQIEYVFETNTQIHCQDYPMYSPEEIRADQIKGLNAVVSLMLSFDEIDNSNERVHEIFTEKAELIPLF